MTAVAGEPPVPNEGVAVPVPPDGQLRGSDDAPPPLDKAVERAADKVVKTGFTGWWATTDDNQKLAWYAILAGALIGPLGQGVPATFGALYKSPVPSGMQLEAVFWLLLITAPVAAFIIVGWLAAGHMPGGAALILAAGVCVLAGGVMNSASIPKSLAGVYCYADASGAPPVYESACREFNNAGFYAENAERVGNPSESANVFSSAVAYTADSRGSLMVFASILASLGVAHLVRREMTT